MIELHDRSGKLLQRISADSFGAALERCARERIALPSLDASGQDLSERNLSGLQAPNISLSGARLNGADISYAQLPGANIDHLQAAGLVAVEVNMKGGAGIHVSMPNSDFTKAEIQGLSAPRIQAAGIILDGAEGEGVNFNSGQLSDMSARGAKFQNSSWRNAVVVNSNNTLSEYVSVDAQDIQARGSDWTGAKLSGNWSGADLSSETDSTGRVVRQTKLVGATIEGEMVGARFTMADASGISIKGNATSSKWMGSTLEDAHLDGIFTRAAFKPYSWADGSAHQETNLRSATLHGVFKRVDCSNANAEGIEISGLIQNSRWAGANLRDMSIGDGLRIAGGEFRDANNVPHLIRERSERVPAPDPNLSVSNSTSAQDRAALGH